MNVCVTLEVFSQSDIKSSDLTNDLGLFFSNHQFENAYLQFDKPYYAAGDTIYFKAYVTQGEEHKPSGLSGVLHVDLINPENKIDQSIKLRLDSGLTWGDFTLPDSLTAGNYRVRAHTQLMRNYGESDFFDKTISVGSLNDDEKNKNPVKELSHEINQKPDLQFFPEGGNLVSGVRSKVAFKAINANGSGIDVKGIILDNSNNEICQFASAHLGMGYFYLSPLEGETYKAKLTFADGTLDSVDLPKADTSGIVLAVNNNSPYVISFKLSVNGPYLAANRNKNFLLLIYSGGKAITYNFKMEVQETTFDMEKRFLSSGIARITLFSPGNEPIGERLVFIQNKDQLELHIIADKTVYTKREKVSLQLNAKDPADSTVAGHFSISVIDENKVPEEENNERTILTDLLLTSELKGYVEQPNYYFNDTSEIARQNLDVLMLTQGYRRFEWKQVMDTSYTPLAFQPEKALRISGKLTDLDGKPLANATVDLIPFKSSTILNSESDNKGFFHFYNLDFTDTTNFVLSVANRKKRNSTRITYFNNYKEPEVITNKKFSIPILKDTAMSVYLDNAKKVREEYGYHFKGKTLNSVIIKGKKPLEDQYRTESLAGVGHADQVMHADEIEKIGGQLTTSLNGRLHGVIFNGGVPFLAGSLQTDPMIVLLDGVVANRLGPDDKILPYDINSIHSPQIETVEVLRNTNTTMYGMIGGNGLLIITTKNGGDYSENIASVGILPIAPMGFYKAIEFYSPKYDNTNADSKQPDLRSTIYWNPEIKTGKDGNASLTYFNADGTGTYKVTIEGIDANGNVGRVVYRYKVE